MGDHEVNDTSISIGFGTTFPFVHSDSNLESEPTCSSIWGPCGNLWTPSTGGEVVGGEGQFQIPSLRLEISANVGNHRLGYFIGLHRYEYHREARDAVSEEISSLDASRTIFEVFGLEYRSPYLLSASYMEGFPEWTELLAAGAGLGLGLTWGEESVSQPGRDPTTEQTELSSSLSVFLRLSAVKFNFGDHVALDLGFMENFLVADHFRSMAGFDTTLEFSF